MASDFQCASVSTHKYAHTHIFSTHREALERVARLSQNRQDDGNSTGAKDALDALRSVRMQEEEESEWELEKSPVQSYLGRRGAIPSKPRSGPKDEKSK